MRKVNKPWGHEIIWAHTDRYVGKILFVRAGEALSLQYHKLKDETIYLYSGSMDLIVEENSEMITIRMKEGDSYHIRPMIKHRMIALSDCSILEASTSELDDVVRIEDRYDRIKND
jgi:oxalate decarboxylase/phosphoglucose isomerase-like protein (cupin superfamily)